MDTKEPMKFVYHFWGHLDCSKVFRTIMVWVNGAFERIREKSDAKRALHRITHPYVGLHNSVLTKKTHEEVICEVRSNDRSETQSTCSLPRDNATRGVGVRDVAEQQVAGSRHGESNGHQKEGNIHGEIRPHHTHHRE